MHVQISKQSRLQLFCDTSSAGHSIMAAEVYVCVCVFTSGATAPREPLCLNSSRSKPAGLRTPSHDIRHQRRHRSNNLISFVCIVKTVKFNNFIAAAAERIDSRRPDGYWRRGGRIELVCLTISCSQRAATGSFYRLNWRRSCLEAGRKFMVCRMCRHVLGLRR